MGLFNDGWEFSRQPLHTTLAQMETRQDAFAKVGLPHDWLIYDTDHLYQDGTGWYRKRFSWRLAEEELVLLRFDGVYMDSRIYVNGHMAFEWKYGYSAFEVDITPYLRDGENVIMVSADYQCPNSRWYSGAGIYRDVWLKTVSRRHMVSDGIYFHAEPVKECEADEGKICWNVEIEAEVAGENAEPAFAWRKAGSGQWLPLEGEISQSKRAPREAGAIGASSQGEATVFLLKAVVNNVEKWDTESPVCYQLRVTLEDHGKVLQTEFLTVGFRTLEFSPDKGFLLNGRRVKLNGVCEHHDLGCLGSAYHTKAMERKLRLLKKMGVNAVRLTHNMHAADVMELADRMGLLIVSEAFDMWESSKTTYDYARFFPEWYARDVASWVRRDRNHPSVIMWSIGNEIYDTHVNAKGQEWTRILLEEVAKHDSKGNARPTIGSNYMPWENAQKCADLVKLAGYNYGEKYYKDHHKAHPDWIIYGSETASVVQSRGIYHFPYRQSVLADVDEQCSALGNSTTSWGARSSEACIIAERDHTFSCGQFLWTGFDYIGEPTPYHTRNSYFGQLDTAGFPKDSFYIYQAEWTDYKSAPMVHIFPYWDFNQGQLIDVRVCSNAPEVELFLNGVSQGSYRIDHAHGEQLSGHWQVPYSPGEITAIAYDENGGEIARESRRSFGEAARIRLTPESDRLQADGQDLLFLEISMEDENGYPVENANNRIYLQTEGCGRLVGMDNGDSTECDGYKAYSRRLFGGKLLAVLKAEARPGELRIKVTSPGLPMASLTIPVTEAPVPQGRSSLAYLAGEPAEVMKEEIPVRGIRLSSSNGQMLKEDNQETLVTARICPKNASDRELIWSIVDDAGIPVTFASFEEAGENRVRVKAKSDGAFRLRCMSRCGTDKIRIISQLEFQVTGLGKAFINPYEFVSAGLYDDSFGDLGNGNEHGVATARDGESGVGFHDIDFGPFGSDEITLPIFALSDESCRIRIYEGMKWEDGAELIGDVNYQKPSIWNVYQEETYRLKKRLKGITSICFVADQKLHLKGFAFTRQSRAWQQISAASCDKLYGDSFRRDGEWIREIGNNVTMEYEGMEFGEKGAGLITICGSTTLDKNTIILRMVSEAGEERRLLEFPGGEELRTFSLDRITGSVTVSFVFLPGSSFDFHWFRFEQ